eukprot:m.46740 g.46740  ORF g.46740 m.46740 type:complete len:61 (-) comp12569_c0_seq2:557-739(-)
MRLSPLSPLLSAAQAERLLQSQLLLPVPLTNTFIAVPTLTTPTAAASVAPTSLFCTPWCG